jgi:hypothetical protein
MLHVKPVLLQGKVRRQAPISIDPVLGHLYEGIALAIPQGEGISGLFELRTCRRVAVDV